MLKINHDRLNPKKGCFKTFLKIIWLIQVDLIRFFFANVHVKGVDF